LSRSGARAGTADVRTESSSRQRLQWLLTVLLVASAYFVAARLSLRLALLPGVTPLWPPSGIALVALLVFGRRVWPGVALSSFLVSLSIGTSPLPSLAIAVGDTLAPLVATALLHRMGFHLELDRERDAVAIVFLAALLSMLVSASIGALTLVISGTIPSSQFWVAWWVWWTGDAMGVLVFAPVLLSVRLPPDPSLRSWHRRLELAALFAALLAVSILVMRSDLALRFLALPFLGWTAWRFQLRGAAPAALLVAVIASWSAVHGLGPFSNGSLLQQMSSLQAFNATVAFTSFFFAAVVTERLRDREALELALSNERRATEQLRALDQTRSRFLSAASHELRTPITISRGHLQVLEPDATPAELESTIAVVLDELDRMRRILDDLSALARRDDAGFLQHEDVDLAELVRSVATKAQPVLGRRVRVAQSPRAMAHIDPQRVTQVVLNLLDNASAHTPEGSSVELRVRDDVSSWAIEVEDSGSGLLPGSEDAVFQAFHKHPQSRGSGLGLAIIRGIAEAHGGSAGVTNRPGQGATFWVKVPR
jgi:signal transduction histidine kinase